MRKYRAQETFDPAPSIMVQSSIDGRAHCYRLLKEQIRDKGKEDPRGIRRRTERL